MPAPKSASNNIKRKKKLNVVNLIFYTKPYQILNYWENELKLFLPCALKLMFHVAR